jgi:hypothetical protein
MAETSKTSKKGRKDGDVPWLSWRYRLSLEKFQRGKNRKWHFSGQQPGEEVVLVARRHWWYLVRPALPMLGSFVVLFALLACSVSWPAQNFIWGPLEIVTFLALLGTGAYFAYKDLITWWYETYIITTTRIINARGLLEPTRQQTPLEKVQQVGIDIDKPLGLLLGFGTVHVYLTGSDFLIRDVPQPRRVRDAILGITEAMKANKPKDAPAPKPADSDMAAVLESLAKEKVIKKLPNADEHLPPLRGSDDRFLGPRRTFGGILRIPCNVRYVSGEYTVKYIQRSFYVLWSMLIVPMAIMILLVPVMILGPATNIIPSAWLGFWWLLTGLGILACLIWMGLIYSNFADDVYILTNRRIIDIQRFFIFFAENNLEVEYKNIRDIKVKVHNLVERFFDVGDVYIETPGNNPDVILSKVDHPFILQDEISGIRSHKEKEDAANKENKEIKLLNKWFGTVLSKLEETTRSRGVPNLREMHVISAMACAQELGLDIAVRGEDDAHPEIPPGHVLWQDPPPGTLMEKGSLVEIVLSKRPVLQTVQQKTGGQG